VGGLVGELHPDALANNLGELAEAGGLGAEHIQSSRVPRARLAWRRAFDESANALLKTGLGLIKSPQNMANASLTPHELARRRTGESGWRTL
jgi:hypothetical protein